MKRTIILLFSLLSITLDIFAYTITVNVHEHGSALCNGVTLREESRSFEVEANSRFELIITPDEGCTEKHFQGGAWHYWPDRRQTPTDASFTVFFDETIDIYFIDVNIPESYTLTVAAKGNGSVIMNQNGEIRNGSQSYSFGSIVTSKAYIKFHPDNGYRMKYVKINGTPMDLNDVKWPYDESGSISITITSDTNVEVEFEAIPITTYTLTIKATGNGFASYSGETIRGGSKSFTLNEGTNATISFSPDDGYRVKSVKVNNSTVDASSSYTVTVNSNTEVAIEFEAIPVTKYTLTIKASGNGSASYSGESIRETTKTYSVNEGSSVSVSFSPDSGYRIKSIKVNNSSLSVNTSYSTTMNSDIKVEVEFEAIPVTTYTLTITAVGGGSVSFNDEMIRETTKTYTFNEGTSFPIYFNRDNGYRIKTVTKNGQNIGTAIIQSAVNMKEDITIYVEFEAIPVDPTPTPQPTTYTLSISAFGNGSASYGGESIRGTTKTYTVNEGTSISVSFSPDSGYRIKSLRVNNSSVSANSSYSATINGNTSIEVEFEAIPVDPTPTPQPTTYTLSISASGNGSASYGGESIRGTTKTYTVNEGTSISVSFSPDSGYRIKSLRVNNSSVSANSSYSATINGNTSIEVEFEAIPVDPTPTPTPTTYTLSISASGNGSVSYNGSTIRGTTSSFTLNEGTSATISFSPDNGYQIKSVSVNGSSVSVGSSYTVTVNSNTTVSVVFEAIPVDPTPTPEPTPTPTTYSLSISATGNGSASYGGTSIRNTSRSFTVDPGTSATITFSPDEGYRIGSIEVNGRGVTTNISYTVTVNENTTVSVVFEEIPVTTYTLTIISQGDGEANYNGSTVRNGSRSFSVGEGSSPRVSFIPDEYNVTKLVKLNGTEVSVSDNRYTINNVTGNNTLEVEFELMESKFSADGVNYQVSSYDNRTVVIGTGDYGLYLEVPEKVVDQGYEWTVAGISEDAINDNKDLAAIIWNPAVTINIRTNNPNFLLYVKDSRYAPSGINNVVVGNTAKSIVLVDTNKDNNFYCPREFTAEKISYSHRYRMRTGGGESKGWETIALPFDVQKIEHAEEGEIFPFANWTIGSTGKPFWLYQLSASGFVEADGIKANTPYIISMPNNDVYQNDYILRGTVSFSASYAVVKKSDNLVKASYGNRTFVPNFTNIENGNGYYALNVNNDVEAYQGSEKEGSVFVQNLRRIHPFEAYMTSTAGSRSIGVFDDMSTAIRDIEVNGENTLKVYNLNGQFIKTGTSMDELRKELPTGLYIINNKKVIVK